MLKRHGPQPPGRHPRFSRGAAPTLETLAQPPELWPRVRRPSSTDPMSPANKPHRGKARCKRKGPNAVCGPVWALLPAHRVQRLPYMRQSGKRNAECAGQFLRGDTVWWLSSQRKEARGAGEGAEGLQEASLGTSADPLRLGRARGGSSCLVYLWGGFTASSEAVEERESGRSRDPADQARVMAPVDMPTARKGMSHTRSLRARRACAFHPQRSDSV